MTDKWYDICDIKKLDQDAGVCALVAGKQVAVFKVGREERTYALDNYCPIGKAFVISRGLVGSLEGRVFVASPLYKNRYFLESGTSTVDDTIQLKTWPTRVRAGRIQLHL